MEVDKLDKDRQHLNLKTGSAIKAPPRGTGIIQEKYGPYYIHGTPDQIANFREEYGYDPSHTRTEIHVTGCSVRDLEPRQLSKIPVFSFEGLEMETRIVRVLDGDTIDAVVYVPLNVIPISSGTGGFFTTLRCRLAGIDCAEKNTPKGEIAVKHMIDLYAKYNNVVYAVFGKADKYGRQLVHLYSKPGPHSEVDCLNFSTLRVTDEHGDPVAVQYFGGKKNPGMGK